jgi:hypothetical protein
MNEETVTETVQPLAATAAGYLPHLEALCLKIFVMCVEWERERGKNENKHSAGCH